MKKYKVNQEIYHRTQLLDDLLEDIPHEVIHMDDCALVQTVEDYFTKNDARVIFPAKSYAVGIIYAKLLEKYFGEDFMSALSDPDLFMGTDKYFNSYGSSRSADFVYDNVLKVLESNKLWDFEKSKIDQVATTVKYFKAEFLLEGM